MDKTIVPGCDFAIHQLKMSRTVDISELLYLHCDPLKEDRLFVNWHDYEHVYSGSFKDAPLSLSGALGYIICDFNINPPVDFNGHSLTAGDIITVDGFGSVYFNKDDFIDIPDFQAHRYFAENRLFDAGIFPECDSCGQQLSGVYNLRSHEAYSSGNFLYMGYAEYKNPLTDKQVSDFRLRPATDNPGNLLVPALQHETQIYGIGLHENLNNITQNRLTLFNTESRLFSLADPSFSVRVKPRFDHISGLFSAQKPLDKAAYSSMIGKSSPASRPEPRPPRFSIKAER